MLRIFLVSCVMTYESGDFTVITNIFPDGMEGEQTWPTEEEIMAAENKTRKVAPIFHCFDCF